MHTFNFQHPNKEITYTWNLREGLLYREQEVLQSLDRSSNMGELLFRLMIYKRVNQFGLNPQRCDDQTEIRALRSYIPRIKELFANDGDTSGFIKSIRGYGYEWLPKVLRDQREEVIPEEIYDPNPPNFQDSMPLFLEKSSEESSLLQHTISVLDLVEEKTRDFVGRDHLFDLVQAFREKNDRGYLVFRGDPGIGKTALMARLLQKHRCVHHFNVRGEGISRADHFLKNLCAQLILKYQLPHKELPPDAARDAVFLKQILQEVSSRVGNTQGALILVDALDEADSHHGANTLFLPKTLPLGIYVVVTTRRTDDVKLYFDCPYTTFDIEHDAGYNLHDVGLYIQQSLSKKGIMNYMSHQSLSPADFLQRLKTKSDGNFMYLRCVLPEIEGGAYRNRPIADVPAGLKRYYEDHWWRMRGADQDSWQKRKLPVVLALTIVREPVSRSLISLFSGVNQESVISAVLYGWRQFLHIRLYPSQDHQEKRYRIYHASYQDFIKNMDEVSAKAAERGFKREVDLQKAHKKVARVLVKDMIEADILEEDFLDDLSEDWESDA